jgi:hypothetical protein
MSTTPQEAAQIDKVDAQLRGVAIIPITIAEAPRDIESLMKLGTYQLRVLMRLFSKSQELWQRRDLDVVDGVYKMELATSVAYLLKQHDAMSEIP